MNGAVIDARRAKPILVVGATGKTGRRVLERLERAGFAARSGARGATPAFDWEDEAGWREALEGAGAAYVAYYPDLTAPGAVDRIRAFTTLALAMDVRRIVLLSGRGEEEAEAAEQVLIGSGADWTILRCAWFMQNFSESFMGEGVSAGELALPAGDVAEPFVDCDDIADVAFAALTEDGHVGRLYELTGPRALTFREAADEIAAARGRKVAYVELPLDAYAAGMRAEGAPAEMADLVVYLFGTLFDGRNSRPAQGVERALKRQATDFAVYARRAAADGAWG